MVPRKPQPDCKANFASEFTAQPAPEDLLGFDKEAHPALEVRRRLESGDPLKGSFKGFLKGSHRTL